MGCVSLHVGYNFREGGAAMRDAYGGAQGEVTAEAHACCANAAGAGGQGKEVVDGFVRVLVV